MFWKKNAVDDSEIEVPKVKLTKKEKFKKEAKSIFWIIFLVLAFRSTFFEPFKIPSGSMIPTLMIGDFILVNKMSYGLKVPFSDWFSDPIYLFEPSKPERGDVIVFKYPKDESINYIKRVVGLPGDTIEILNKKLYINDEEIETVDFDGSKIMEDMDEKFQNLNFRFFKTKTGEHVHITQIHEDNIFNSNYPRKTIPEGNYFVMGDNRDFSSDSRSWGFVPFENIKGEAMLVWFSLSLPFAYEEVYNFRPWRIETLIDSAPGLD